MGTVVGLIPAEDSPLGTIAAMEARLALVRAAVEGNPTAVECCEVTRRTFEQERARIFDDPEVRAKWCRVAKILGTAN